MAARKVCSAAAATITAGLLAATGATAQTAKPVTTPEGVVHVPAFDLPPSGLMSPEAVETLKRRAGKPYAGWPQGADIAEVRQEAERRLGPLVEAMRARYDVDIREQTIGGLRVRVFTPKAGPIDDKRVLINLHGGGFMLCADACALLESIPIAALGGFKVISVDYRQGPEAVFPAASEDVAAVYRELLKSYKPKQIGIYGCSAGGALAAQAAAWLSAKDLPQAGAIGVFGMGGVLSARGDSAFVSAYIDGQFPPPPPPGESVLRGPFRSYFEGADFKDPLVSPAAHPDVLAKFPPTLVITATRAFELSPAVYTHSQLLKAGASSDLIVAEGLGHCYIYESQLPEARDAYRVIVDFFKANLGG